MEGNQKGLEGGTGERGDLHLKPPPSTPGEVGVEKEDPGCAPPHVNGR